MRRRFLLLIGLVCTTNLVFAQATKEYKSYHDRWETKIYSIENKTDLGQFHGLQKYYDESGQLRESTMYKLGKKDGLKKQYFASGKPAKEHNYKQDVEHGPFKIWGYDKETYYLYSSGNYDNGVLITEETFHSNGKKRSIYNRDGLNVTWYPNGQKYAEFNRMDDVTEGKFSGWYEDGSKMLDASYVNGQEDGKWTHYGTEGKVIRQEEWSKGNRVGQWKYYYTFENENAIQITSLSEATNYIEVNHDEFILDYRDKENYSAKGFLANDILIWEGHLVWSPVKVRDSDFNNWIQVGPMKFYEDGGLVAEGTLVLVDANTTRISSVKDGEWKYYENGKLYYIEKYNRGNVVEGYEVKEE